MSQVFGFTPYYFSKDIPPDHLKLDTNSAKFLSNQLTYIMTDSKQEKITISQQTAPATIKNMEGESAQTTLGTATIKTGSGQISAQVVTSDKTLITLHASDFISSGTLIDIYNSMHTVSKGVQVTP